MAQGDIDLPSVPDVTASTRHLPFWVRGLVFVAIFPLLGFIALSGRTLWAEWNSLKKDHVAVRNSVVVGYLNINPNPSYAGRPDNWFHSEGDEDVFWSGWKNGENHWFRCGRGEINTGLLSMPIGRDVIQAIDYPIFEKGSGARWERIPETAPVIGLEGKSGATSYPMKVLEKVLVINDDTGDRPYLLVFTPYEPEITIYEASLDGGRVTMGHSGYFIGHRPVLYNRGTECLWSEQDGSMVALSGSRKGSSLKLVSRIPPVAWGDWLAKHPDSRLLIGADRSQAFPVN